jgi:hypothetical protein
MWSYLVQTPTVLRESGESRDAMTKQFGWNPYQIKLSVTIKWLVTYLESEDSVLSLTSVEFEISLKDLYDGVNFEEAD